ncbi:hypothetical protein [Oryza sativa Japonica Group]|uniref:Uncharacterized protein n=1 Tax=Oryza sativa subsp. japonica TaxID=39947 RepID=Q5ZBK2_ORYSJ|nr:hypothetical protein [Oryza sativa Japonica Group]
MLNLQLLEAWLGLNVALGHWIGWITLVSRSLLLAGEPIGNLMALRDGALKRHKEIEQISVKQ